jgi:glycosyltransferase involved in cell wall biosynthesis
MRVLVISHAAVIPENQAPYCEMERLEGMEVALIVPRVWRASVGGPKAFVRHERLQAEVVERNVRFNGHINLHYYPGLSLPALPFLPDVVYADEDAHSLAAYQALRLAQTVRAAFVFKSNQNTARIYPPPFRWMEGAVLRGADGAIAIAPACAEVLRAKEFRAAIDVIGHGVDPEVFQPRDEAERRGKLGLEGFVVGYMGRLSVEKGVDTLIWGFHRLVDHCMGEPPAMLLIVGDGPERARLEALARRLLAPECVVFAGAVPHGEAARYLSCMDVLVLPSRTTRSWKEQFGRVIIEAMACGVPVIGSDSGNIPELVKETGGGVVFPEANWRELAVELGKLARNPEAARELGRTGRAAVLERYTYPALARRIAAALRHAVTRHDAG